jgi:signal transduction histidine kinase
MTTRKKAIVQFIEMKQAGSGRKRITAEERKALESVNQKVAAGQTLDEVMNFVFDVTRETYPCDRLSVAFLEENETRVVSRWTRALYEPVLLREGFHQDIEGSSLQQVLASGNARIINDLGQYVEAHPSSVSTQLILREGVRSNMTCPLVVEGRRIGFLFRSSRRPNAYDERQVHIHHVMAERLSQAVEKAWRIGQLTAANRAYTEVLGFVAHELRSPLASLVMDGRVVLDGYLGEVDPRHAERIRQMVRKAEYLLGLIGDYLDLAQIEQGELHVAVRRGVSFAEEIADYVISMVKPQFEAKDIAFINEIPPDFPGVDCDPKLMRVVLTNFLSNAAKYSPREACVRLGARKTDDAFELSVWNEGPGFDERERALLFRKFSRLKSPELAREKGSGVGLYSVWRIAQLHGGKVWAESEKGKWARFSFRIPQPLFPDQEETDADSAGPEAGS